MESNSDKQLRDKLTGVGFPFDPQAWEQMEAMLDKKKKRRGFFWWWTGGIAAALLFAVVGYELGVNSSNKQLATNNEQEIEVKNEMPEVSSSVVVGNRSEQEYVNGRQQAATNQQQIINDKKAKQKESSTAVSNSNQQKSTTSKKLRTLKHSNAQTNDKQQTTNGKNVSSNPSNPRHQRANASSRKQQLLKKATEGNISTIVSAFENNPLQQQTNLLASSTTKDLLAKRIEMDGRAGFLESSEQEYSFSKVSEESLPKTKKKIFNYSLGAVANITGTMVSDFGFRKFYSQPSFAAGLTHEFLFINRIAITNALLYSQTGFQIKEPNAPADSLATTLSYSSAIKELQIPIGIKAYPVNKKWFRFSIAAGIINHIKLTEFFTVEKQHYQYQITPPTPPITNFDNTVTTGNNPFVEGLNKSSNLSDQARTQGEQGEYFGMGGLRRYYASFYASAGIEFIAKRKFIFFTEPLFYMSLNKIGLQDKRKYNVGASAGFRYQF